MIQFEIPAAFGDPASIYFAREEASLIVSQSDSDAIDALRVEVFDLGDNAEFVAFRKRVRKQISTLDNGSAGREWYLYSLRELLYHSFCMQGRNTSARRVLNDIVANERLTNSGIRLLTMRYDAGLVASHRAVQIAERILEATETVGHDYTRRAYCFHLLILANIHINRLQRAREWFLALFRECSGEFLYSPYYFSLAVIRAFLSKRISFAELVDYADEMLEPRFLDPVGKVGPRELDRLRHRLKALLDSGLDAT